MDLSRYTTANNQTALDNSEPAQNGGGADASAPTDMRWLAIDEISTLVPLPSGYYLEWLTRSEIPALISKIQIWHPDISIGAASCYLSEDFYRDSVYFEGEPKKDIGVLLFKYKGTLAGMWSVEREPDALAVFCRLVIVAPEHRGSGVVVSAAAGSERCARAMGAEFLYTFATLKNPYIQLALEGLGYRIVGFNPGHDRELVCPGVAKRVYEAIYAKVLVPDDALLRPDPRNLTPKTREVFDFFFAT